ncbi:MAG: cupin domain-containing protein [Calditrichota bacterium]
MAGCTGYPEGTKIKVLREEKSARTFLLKIPADFDMKSHSHMTTEQHFVLEGQYESDGKKYGEGIFRLIPRGIDHGPFTSEKGATILVIWDPL